MTEAKVEVSHTQLTHQDIWANKGKWYEESKQSEEYWEQNMSEDEREALTRIVRRSIERFYDSIDDWLPEALVQKGGEYLEVRMGILLTDIDREIDQAEEATSFQLKEAKSDLEKMVQEMHSKDSGEE